MDSVLTRYHQYKLCWLRSVDIAIWCNNNKIPNYCGGRQSDSLASPQQRLQWTWPWVVRKCCRRELAAWKETSQLRRVIIFDAGEEHSDYLTDEEEVWDIPPAMFEYSSKSSYSL